MTLPTLSFGEFFDEEHVLRSSLEDLSPLDQGLIDGIVAGQHDDCALSQHHREDLSVTLPEWA